MGRINPRQKLSIKKKTNKKPSKKHIRSHFARKMAGEAPPDHKRKGSQKLSQRALRLVQGLVVENMDLQEKVEDVKEFGVVKQIETEESIQSIKEQNQKLQEQIEQLQQQLQQQARSRELVEENEKLQQQLKDKDVEVETVKEENRKMFFFRNNEINQLRITCNRLRQERAEAWSRADAAHSLLESYKTHHNLP